MSNFKHLLLILWTVFHCIHAEANTAVGTVLWDNWYTVTDHGLPNSYYNEKATITGDRVKIQVNTWIKAAKGLRVESLGASAKNTPLLEPLLYNFHTSENGEEKNIDGTVLENGKIFSVKIKKGNQASKSLRAEMLPKLILSSFFPLWINKNYKRISGVQPIEFQAIMEDQVDDQVTAVKGTAYEELQDAFAKTSGTRKLRIEFAQVVAHWWVTKNGDAIQIELPSAGRSVKKTDQATAQKFLTP